MRISVSRARMRVAMRGVGLRILGVNVAIFRLITMGGCWGLLWGGGGCYF